MDSSSDDKPNFVGPAFSSPNIKFKTFSSLVSKGGANPYHIRFVCVKRTLVAFYFTRAQMGNKKTYANHLMRLAVVKERGWAATINVDDCEYFLHVDGKVQPHFQGSQYNKRLFSVNGSFTFESLLRSLTLFVLLLSL